MQTLLVIVALGGIFGHGGLFSGFGGSCANGQCSVAPSAVASIPAPVQYIPAPVQSVPAQASSCYSSSAPVQGNSCYSQPSLAPPTEYKFSGRKSISNPVLKTVPRTAPPARTRFASVQQEKLERIPTAEPGPAYNPDQEGPVITEIVIKAERPMIFQFYHPEVATRR